MPATKHWDSYVDHDTAVKFYEDFLTVAVAARTGQDAGDLHVLRHDAGAAGL